MNENAKKYFIGAVVKESERYKKRMYGACTLKLIQQNGFSIMHFIFMLKRSYDYEND